MLSSIITAFARLPPQHHKHLTAEVAEPLGCTMAQLALAWCTKNPHVSTVITGASRASQVLENFETLDVLPLLTDEVKARIEAALR